MMSSSVMNGQQKCDFGKHGVVFVAAGMILSIHLPMLLGNYFMAGIDTVFIVMRLVLYFLIPTIEPSGN